MIKMLHGSLDPLLEVANKVADIKNLLSLCPMSDFSIVEMHALKSRS